jgi:hypothetical protein
MRIGFACRRVWDESLGQRTRALHERLDEAGSCGPASDLQVLIEHCGLIVADQETPFAFGAVVEPRLLVKQRAVAQGADRKRVMRQGAVVARQKSHAKLQGNIRAM